MSFQLVQFYVLPCTGNIVMLIHSGYSMKEATGSLLDMGGATMMSDASIRVLRTQYHRNGKAFPFSIIPIRFHSNVQVSLETN